MSLSAEATAAAELTDREVRTAAMAAVQERVTARVPEARLQQQIKRVWPRRLGSPVPGDHVHLLDLAHDLALFARDPKGRNAFDRLVRARPFAAGSAEASALELMRGARPVAMEVMDVDMLGRVDARDLVSDERVHLDACEVAPGDRLQRSGGDGGRRESRGASAALRHRPGAGDCGECLRARAHTD